VNLEVDGNVLEGRAASVHGPAIWFWEQFINFVCSILCVVEAGRFTFLAGNKALHVLQKCRA
jgi:hypothetical protein